MTLYFRVISLLGHNLTFQSKKKENSIYLIQSFYSIFFFVSMNYDRFVGSSSQVLQNRLKFKSSSALIENQLIVSHKNTTGIFEFSSYSLFTSSYTRHYIQGAIKRGWGTCGTFKAFNLTYLHILPAGIVYIQANP